MGYRTQRWLWLLLINVSLAQASIYVVRPMITYRALENGASGYEIGLIAAVYALAPLLIAVPMGRWVGKIGERPLLFAGCLSFILLGIAFAFLNNIIAIAAATAITGIAHLSNVAASQAMVANRSPMNMQDQNFGYFSFSTSLGHSVGPALGGGSCWFCWSAATLLNFCFYLCLYFGSYSLSANLSLSRSKRS